MRPALEDVYGKQTPSARNLFFPAKLIYVPSIKMYRRLRFRSVHFLGTSVKKIKKKRRKIHFSPFFLFSSSLPGAQPEILWEKVIFWVCTPSCRSKINNWPDTFDPPKYASVYVATEFRVARGGSGTNFLRAPLRLTAMS